MKLLFITQKVDKDDSLLGIYHQWLELLAPRFERIEVVCLGMGRVELPENVFVHSLGKENAIYKRSSIRRKLNYIAAYRSLLASISHDAVFVHMNQEYILLSGWWWKLRGVPIYFWRNHPAGNWMTRISYFFANKVLYTSPDSYSAKHAGAKGVQMPVGVDVEKFKAQNAKLKSAGQRMKIVYVGRVSPVKNIHVMFEAARILQNRGIDFFLDLYGDPVNRAEDKNYFDTLQSLAINHSLPITFYKSVPHERVPELYTNADCSINVTAAGSMDKSIFEAMACEVPVLFSNKALESEFPELFVRELNTHFLAEKLQWFSGLDEKARSELGRKCREYVVKEHGLEKLIDELIRQLR